MKYLITNLPQPYPRGGAQERGGGVFKVEKSMEEFEADGGRGGQGRKERRGKGDRGGEGRRKRE